MSPVVRKIAREYRIDVRNIAGSGAGGRVTKADILAYIEAGSPAPAPSAAPAAPRAAELLAPNPAAVAGLDASKYERTPMSVMRRKIAEHMVMSKRTSMHVHSAFEVDFTRVDEIRKAKKTEYENAGGKLTYMSFITKACAGALKAVPVVNSSVDGTDVIYKKDVNIGIAVALDWGLIVPVVKNADTLSLLEISRSIVDLAGRARDKKLKTDEVQGGTFTITNPGAVRHADHQPAAGRHRRRRCRREAARGGRRSDCHPPARVHDARLRPSHHRRRRRRSVHAARQEDHRELGHRDGVGVSHGGVGRVGPPRDPRYH
jgi:2-oxoglutarate dehydrogenase E2 component (dihydrolipoamide succinyltransferase)